MIDLDLVVELIIVRCIYVIMLLIVCVVVSIDRFCEFFIRCFFCVMINFFLGVVLWGNCEEGGLEFKRVIVILKSF